METLGNEALGRILNIMDEARLVAQVGHVCKKPQTSVLNVLSHTSVGMNTQAPNNVTHQSKEMESYDVNIAVIFSQQSLSTHMESENKTVRQKEKLR